ncbi:MAG: PD-(D/E)XK nuclease family protein, partial [Dehalococcoidia bacterium]
MNIPETIPDPRSSVVTLPGAKAELEALLAAVQRAGPLTPVTVAGPSNYANLSLRHGLGRRGFANVRFMAVSRLAELLGAPALGQQGRRPLTGMLESAAVRAVAQRARDPLDGLRDHPALHRGLLATFRDLRRSPEGAGDKAAGRDPLHAEVVRLYRRWLELTLPFYDREALAWSAADAVASGQASALHDLGVVVFYLPTELSPGERALARSLLERGQCFTVLGLTGDPLADEGVREMAHALGIGEAAPEAPGQDGVSTHILLAPDPREEVTWVLRQVMQAAEAGTPLHRIAVLYRQSQPYARLVREQCELSGIPVAGPGVTTLAERAVGRTLTGLLALASGELDRDEVMEWLASCPVAPPPTAGSRTPGHSFHPSQWDALSRAAGIVRGKEQWLERLEQYALKLEGRAGDPEARDRRSEAALERMHREAAEARALASFIDRLAVDLRLPPEGSSWQTYAEWTETLLDRYLNVSGVLPAEETAALDRLKEILRELPGISAVHKEADFDSFRSEVAEALAVSTGHSGRTGEGLFVASFRAAHGMEFDAVFLLGMVEGAVPPRVADDPLLPDRARRATGVPLRGARAREERYAYLAALESAPRRSLSFPKADPASQRKYFPSRWLLEQASLLEGERIFSTGLEQLGQRSWLTRLASRQEGLRAAIAPADLHDRDLQELLAWNEAGRPLDGHALALDGQVARAIAMRRSRIAHGLTVWDGDASGVAATSRRIRPPGVQVLSPSRLQTWAKCPFSYYVSSVLGIAALDTPEDTDVITPVDRGTLVHEVLERFISEAIQRGAPKPEQAWTAADRERLHTLAEAAFAGVEARGLTGRPLLWELEREAIREDLDEFLRQDSRMRSELDATPWRVELGFGFESEGPSLEGTAGVRLAFRGMIDRVDRMADGGALVLDYKTGGNYLYRGLDTDPVDRGRLLQLPVYGMAARQALGDDG